MIVKSLYGNKTQFTYHETINISYFLNINKFSHILDIEIRQTYRQWCKNDSQDNRGNKYKI